MHGTPAVEVSHTLWRWTEGATYIRQGASSWASAHILVLFILFHLQLWLFLLVPKIDKNEIHAVLSVWEITTRQSQNAAIGTMTSIAWTLTINMRGL